MKVLLIGTGTVGEAIAKLSRGRPWLEKMVLADYDLDRAKLVHSVVGHDPRYSAVRLDASRKADIVALAKAEKVDLVMNSVDPRFVMPIFEAALEVGIDYVQGFFLQRPHTDMSYDFAQVVL